ncbi:uncharacterized protein LOC115625075 [Scaptodrosophila lebanonensis]|uniref:Uncharacterized protein LOC115625075 n=1 Tax=Drosophila lebanonensis TaxID=7225 RepID=A0A6J2TL09_DROLE|nr:uncharacterized protein LOC115625075 [Scaptodrosophila lebanonensis]
MRQRLMQQMHRQQKQQQQLTHSTNITNNTKLTNSCSTQTLASHLAKLRSNGQQSRHSMDQLPTQRLSNSTEQLQQRFGSIADDYRKNLFGTLTPQHRVRSSVKQTSEEELQDESFIVNAAFDEIFARYSGVDEDDTENGDEYTAQVHTATNTDDLYDEDDDENMLVSLSELDDDVFASRTQTAATTPTTNAGRTPKHSCGALKKPRAPAPPLQQRSNTLSNLFERLKGSNMHSSVVGTTTPTQRSRRSLNKTNSEQQLQPTTASTLAAMRKYPAQLQLNGESVADFNRGSTLSQSFVRQLKKASFKTKRAPPAPPPKPRGSNVAHVTPLRNVLIFPKRSKSSNELLLDDLNVQARKYYSKPEGETPQPGHRKNLHSALL